MHVRLIRVIGSERVKLLETAIVVSGSKFMREEFRKSRTDTQLWIQASEENMDNLDWNLNVNIELILIFSIVFVHGLDLYSLQMHLQCLLSFDRWNLCGSWQAPMNFRSSPISHTSMTWVRLKPFFQHFSSPATTAHYVTRHITKMPFLKAQILPMMKRSFKLQHTPLQVILKKFWKMGRKNEQVS